MATNNNQRLLVTDLDGTLIGDDEAMHLLLRELEQHNIIVAFATGRHIASVEAFYAEKQLSFRADACLCMVGTDIHIRRGQHYELDPAWHRNIAEGWDQGAVEAILSRMPGIRRQDASWQSPFKSSYYVLTDDPSALGATVTVEEIRRQLASKSIPAKVIHSADTFLDVIPVRAGKGEAALHLSQHLNLTPSEVITCGDTGNDADMMRPELGFRSVIVGNATPELKALRGNHLYHAQSSYAAGVREGLETLDWL